MGQRPLSALIAALIVLGAARARADGEELASIDAVHEACEAARENPRPRLYAIEVDYRLGRYDEENGRLRVDTRRNLTALDGHVSVLIASFEEVAFEATPEQASTLREAARSGAKLRIGFFLGFDDPMRQPCLVRGAHAVTIVRADVAFAELVSGAGERIARTDGDRLRAWLDDARASRIEGDGPRGAVGTGSFDNAQAPPETWQRALQAQVVRTRIGQCHAEGIGRGASREGDVVVRLNIETRSGRIRRADVAISSLRDAPEAECIARALGGATIPPGPSGWPEAVDLSVPVRVTAD
jgi:hypothetical protein